MIEYYLELDSAQLTNLNKAENLCIFFIDHGYSMQNQHESGCGHLVNHSTVFI